jgi:tetratricopeptide (TPR) repeat protein
MGSRASLFHDLQQLREAENGYLEAIKILRQQEAESVKAHLAPLLISLAALYLETDQPSKALSLGLEELILSIDSRSLKAQAYGTLGAIAFAQKKIPAAESWWLRSLAMSEADNNLEDAAAVLSNLGLLAASKGDMQGSTVYFRKSVEHFRSTLGLEHPLSAKPQGNLGYALYRAGAYDESAEWLQNAYAVAKRWYGGENAVTIVLGLDYVAALRKSGRKHEAKAALKQMPKVPAAVLAALPGRNTVDVLSLGR